MKKQLLKSSIITFILIIFFINISFAATGENIFSGSTFHTGGVEEKEKDEPKKSLNTLELFKDNQYDLIFENETEVFDLESNNIFNISNKIKIFKNIGEGIKHRIDETNKSLDQTQNRIISLEEAINSLNNDINDIVYEIKKLNIDITKLKNDILSNNEQIDILREKVSKNRRVLQNYIRYIYKKGNIIFKEGAVDNLKAILLGKTSISELIDDLYYKTLIELVGRSILDEHRTLIKDLYLQRLRFEENQNKLRLVRKTEFIKKKVLKDKRDFKNRLMVTSKGKEILYKQFIEKKIELERAVKFKELKEKIKLKNISDNLLSKHNCEYINLDDKTQDDLLELNLSERCYNLNKILLSESQLKPFEDIKANNFLSWPVTLKYGISTFFHDPDYKYQFGSDHEGLDIRALQGTSIKSPAEGYVIFISPPKDDTYSYIAIKHSNGFVTVYGHLSEILVENYDYVKKGQVFAKTGGEFGTPGAGLLTTGPHLHFEVFRDKQYRDPLNFLDISFFSFSSLPSRYEQKYKSDFKLRKGYEYKLSLEEEENKVFKIKGNSEEERQKYLVETYAAKDFRDWNVWVEEALDANIDPTFLMCVSIAESTMGHYLKSPYNIGNVGNNDSGDTIDFPDARSGIRAMAYTFNNQFLGKYNTIKDLSRFGNRKGLIYASSGYNWHNNIIKCMSSIKDKQVLDDYAFRIVK